MSVAVLWGCGGGNTNAPTTTGFTRRAFVSNSFSGFIDIINATTDDARGDRIGTDPGPMRMSLSPDKSVTLVYTDGLKRIDAVSNGDEVVLGSAQLADESISFFYLPDNKIVYIAVRNAGQVVRWDTSTGTTTTIAVPNPLRMVRSGDGKHVLVFPDDASDTVYYIDTTVATPTATAVTGFDRPVWAVFSSDNTKAWVLNCGPECGGTTAGVQVLNTPALSLGASAAVPGGATHALLSGTTLYVAGTPPANACSFDATVNCGFLTRVDVSGAPAAGASFEITDGYHSKMLLASNNKLFIGAEFTCAAIAPNGCLSIFNTSGNAVSIKPPCGPSCNSLNDVTGMAQIPGRNVVYVVEGGEVRIYDTTTDALQSKQVDTLGRSWDVVSPD
jgi:hypothetical protein